MKNASNSHIYLDHAAISPPRPEVIQEVRRVSSEVWGNPNSLHAAGRAAKAVLEHARQVVAEELFGVSNREVVFTSGGTESNALAILGTVSHQAAAKGLSQVHVISQPTEHVSVLRTLQHLERQGVQVTWLEVDEFGRVSPEEVVQALRPNTCLISLMAANNEVGTLQPIADLSAQVKQVAPQVAIHTDACQAVGELDLKTLKQVDFISVTGTKFGGPVLGAVCVKQPKQLAPVWQGGGQERGFRSGTQPVSQISGFATAVQSLKADQQSMHHRLTAWRDELISTLLLIPGARLNGHPTERLAHNIHLSFPDISGERLLVALDQQGVFASTGSACAAGSQEPSHVLQALGLPKNYIRGSLRLTLGWNTTQQEVTAAKQLLPQVIHSLQN